MHGKPLNLPNYNYVRFGKYSLRYQASKYWNALNVNFHEINNLNQFKNALESCESLFRLICIYLIVLIWLDKSLARLCFLVMRIPTVRH